MKLGIIGFGVVGKSVLACVRNPQVYGSMGLPILTDAQQLCVRVWDARQLTQDEHNIIQTYKADAVEASRMSLIDFIKDNDYIVLSPGVGLNQYKEFVATFLCELDLFATLFKKPVIAVTGSFGKTTITKLLGKIVSMVPAIPKSLDFLTECDAGKRNRKFLVGGNVGIGMLDLIPHQDSCDGAVLELSSFQLEHSKKFAPDLAIWTNLYPNHLDRHQTLFDYFEAKFNLLRFQKKENVALLNFDLFEGQIGDWFNERLEVVQSTIYIYTTRSIDQISLHSIKRHEFYLFYSNGSHLHKAKIVNGVLQDTISLLDMSWLPDITFLQNWIAVIGALHILGTDFAELKNLITTIQEPLLDEHHHRLEYVATINNVDFYNDSKSTVAQTTLAAFDKLAGHGRPIILIIGGLGKGVDRAPILASLHISSLLKKMYCFGADCARFTNCIKMSTLEEVVADIARIMQPGDIVLFSPSGTSYDLFKNFEHRGNVFKDLIKKLPINSCS